MLNQTILVVDAEPDGRKVLENLPGLENYRVLAAGSAQEALHKLTQLQATEHATPDLIISNGLFMAGDKRELNDSPTKAEFLQEIGYISIRAALQSDWAERNSFNIFIPKPADQKEVANLAKQLLLHFMLPIYPPPTNCHGLFLL